MQQRDAGTHDQFSFGKICRELAEMLHAEGWEDGAGSFLVFGEADLLIGFAAGGLEGRFLEGVGSAWGLLFVSMG
jgi:hypothetical protein